MKDISAVRLRRPVVLSALSAAMLLIGYVTLARGDVTMAPLLLVAAYVVGVPSALLAD